MPIECDDFLTASDFIISSAPEDEVFCRVALGRAYYSLYHHAKIKADELTLPEVAGHGMGEHKRLVARYQTAGKRLKVIGNMIDKMRAIRADVDYDLEGDYPRQQALKDIQVCRSVILEVQKINAVVKKEG